GGIGQRAAGKGQPARQGDVVVGEAAEDLLDFGADLGAGQLEETSDAQLFRAGAQQLGGAAVAEEEAERFEQERLAGARLAGPGAEARLQLDADVFDQREVLDDQLAEHDTVDATAAPGGAEGEMALQV